MSASIVVAAIAVLGAVSIHFLTQRQASLERKRKACAKAMSDALNWMELPYRIRRRPDNSASTLSELSGRMHYLQERLLFHESWLKVEVPQVYPAYRDMVSEIKKVTKDANREAWESPPANIHTMNIGDLGLESPDRFVEKFSEKVKKHLVLWRVWG